MTPELAGQGADLRVADWTAYDRRLGPLLDGSAFRGLPRDGVPVRAFYVPFHENWPLRLEDHYEQGAPPEWEWSKTSKTSEHTPPPQDTKWKDLHDLTVSPIRDAFDEAYKKGFVNVVEDFVKHYDGKGWTYPYCQLYQNNKFGHRGQWWTLDEPNEWADWAALAFWANLFHEGMDFPHKAQFLYRGDISRPHWQGSFMDGFMDVMYSGGTALRWPRLMRHLRERTGMMLSVYGSCNEVGRNNLESAAWCLKAHAVWADGVLPWNSLGSEEAYVEPDQTGLLLPGERFGVTAVASTRLAAMRHGAQICELLGQVLESRKDWTRWHTTLLTGRKVPLGAEFRQRFTDEAAAATFDELTGEQFAQLKEGLLLLLSKGTSGREAQEIRGDALPTATSGQDAAE